MIHTEMNVMITIWSQYVHTLQQINMADVVTLISRQISFFPFLDVIVVAMVLIFSNEKYFRLIKKL